MPDDVQMGKASNNNWHDYQASFIAASVSKSLEYNAWVNGISDELIDEHEFYFIQDSPKIWSRREYRQRVNRIAAEVLEKYDGQLTDECKYELYTHGITTTDDESFYNLWTKSCDEFADRLIHEATIDFIKQHENNPVEEFIKHLKKIYPKIYPESNASKHPQLLKSFEHSPFPSEEEKLALMNITGFSRQTLENWFHMERARRRRYGENVIKYPSLGDKYPELVHQFNTDPFLSSDEKLELMDITGLSHTKIENWFQHERTRRRTNGEDLLKYIPLSDKYPELQELFERNSFPSSEEKLELMDKTGLSRMVLDNWFMHERNRRRKNGETVTEKSFLSDDYPELKKQFDKDPFLSSEETLELMNLTGLSRTKIENWFRKERNRRRKNGEDIPRNSFSIKYPQLEEQFKNNPRPNESDFLRLVNETGLSETQVYCWFNKKQWLNGLSGPVISDRIRPSLAKSYPELQQQFNIDPYPSQDQS